MYYLSVAVVGNFCASRRKLIATETHASLFKVDRSCRGVSPLCSSDLLPWNVPCGERPTRNIVSFDVLIAFQMPADNLQWNPRTVHRCAISGNIPPRYLSAPNSTCKLISPSLSIHVYSLRLSPKRFFNWPRDSFVIRRTPLPRGTRRPFRHGRSLRSGFFLISFTSLS